MENYNTEIENKNKTIGSGNYNSSLPKLLSRRSGIIMAAIYSVDIINRHCWGGVHGAMVKAACLKSRRLRVRAPLWHSSFKQNVSPFMIQY